MAEYRDGSFIDDACAEIAAEEYARGYEEGSRLVAERALQLLDAAYAQPKDSRIREWLVGWSLGYLRLVLEGREPGAAGLREALSWMMEQQHRDAKAGAV